jgi:hypothetical protein
MVQTPSNRLQPHWPQTVAKEASSDHLQQPETSSQPDWKSRLVSCLADRPGTTLAAAALVGLAVGWIVKRK